MALSINHHIDYLDKALLHHIVNRLRLLLLLLFSTLSVAAQELPELGDSSSASLTPQQAQQIGREMVRGMRQAGYIIDDPLISGYISELGGSLAAHADTTQQFTFFVVDAESINAFALPGGFIGVHSGLILASRSESELASVMAHEIAHITQHHLERGVEQANRMNLPLTLALLASILLSGGDPNVANAAMAATLGGSTQMQLNFTRAHEQEADRVGMQLLASSQYEPQGMAAFFTRIQEQARYDGEGAPEFLRTHPVTTARLAEAQSAAARYPRKMHADTTSYQVARARVRLHHSGSAEQLLREIQSKPQHQVKAATSDTGYLQAITHIALQQPKLGEQLLQQLLASHPESIAYRETLGQHLFSQGRYAQASSLYRDGLVRYPNNELLLLSLCKNLLASSRLDTAREKLQGVLRRNPSSAPAYQLLAQLESQAAKPAAAHLAQAHYYLLTGEPHSALEQLKLTKQLDTRDFYLTSRIEALRKEITLSLELQHALSSH